MTSILCQKRFQKDKAFLALFSCSISKYHDSSKKIDNLSAPLPSLEKSIFAFKTFASEETSALLGFFIALFLMLKYSKYNLQQIFITILKAQTFTIVTPLL